MNEEERGDVEETHYKLPYIGELTSKQLVLAIVGLALVLRLLWALAVPVVPVSDSAAYDAFAQNIAGGHGYGWEPGQLTAYWAVGPSAAYALLYWLFGHSYVPIVILNLFLGAASVHLVIRLGERYFDLRVGLLAGALLAIWPSQVQFTTVLASELQFTFLVLLGLYVWPRKDRNVWVAAVLAGIVLAAAAYVRPTGLLLPILFGGLTALRESSYLKQTACVTLCFVVMFALILPWSMRNKELFGEFVLISTNGGPNFWMGNNPETTGEYMSPPHFPGLNEAQRDNRLRDEAMAYIKAEPGAFVLRTLRKAVRLHSHESIGVGWNERGLAKRIPDGAIEMLKHMSSLYWLGMLALGLGGLGLFVKQQWPVRREHRLPEWLIELARLATNPAILIWAYFAAVHSITVVQDRYHFASIPFIAMLAGVALMEGAKWLGIHKANAGELAER